MEPISENKRTREIISKFVTYARNSQIYLQMKHYDQDIFETTRYKDGEFTNWLFFKYMPLAIYFPQEDVVLTSQNLRTLDTQDRNRALANFLTFIKKQGFSEDRIRQTMSTIQCYDPNLYDYIYQIKNYDSYILSVRENNLVSLYSYDRLLCCALSTDLYLFNTDEDVDVRDEASLNQFLVDNGIPIIDPKDKKFHYISFKHEGLMK